jgi:hypothetical protein
MRKWDKQGDGLIAMHNARALHRLMNLMRG